MAFEPNKVAPNSDQDTSMAFTTNRERLTEEQERKAVELMAMWLQDRDSNSLTRKLITIWEHIDEDKKANFFASLKRELSQVLRQQADLIENS